MKLLVSAQPGERRAAWIDDGRLVDLLIQRDDHPSRLAEIHLGRVTALDRSLKAAFIDLGLERAGFLPLSEAPGMRLIEGAAVTVRVLRDATLDKGPRLTARLIDPPPDLAQLSRDAKPPCRLLPGDDPLTRMLKARELPEEILVDHAETFRALKARATAARPELGALLRLDLGAQPLFERNVITAGPEGETVEAAIEALLEPRVALPSGGVLWIEPTHGLVAIDVDSGRQAAGGARELALAVDLEAAAEIPRQLRLRALSGQIVIDFLELKETGARRRVVEALREGLAGDREPVRVGAMAASGLLVVTRRRGAPALHEILSEPCGDGGGGQRKTAVTLAFEALRSAHRLAGEAPGATVTLTAGTAVLTALEGPAKRAREELEGRLGRKLALIRGEFPGDRGYEVGLERPKPGRG